jgi:hypothetical protein
MQAKRMNKSRKHQFQSKVSFFQSYSYSRISSIINRRIQILKSLDKIVKENIISTKIAVCAKFSPHAILNVHG